ncbi:MAG: hypothetical protein ABIO49_16740 [Dokdonella sp.]
MLVDQDGGECFVRNLAQRGADKTLRLGHKDLLKWQARTRQRLRMWVCSRRRVE